MLSFAFGVSGSFLFPKLKPKFACFVSSIDLNSSGGNTSPDSQIIKLKEWVTKEEPMIFTSASSHKINYNRPFAQSSF